MSRRLGSIAILIAGEETGATTKAFRVATNVNKVGASRHDHAPWSSYFEQVRTR